MKEWEARLPKEEYWKQKWWRDMVNELHEFAKKKDEELLKAFEYMKEGAELAKVPYYEFVWRVIWDAEEADAKAIAKKKAEKKAREWLDDKLYGSKDGEGKDFKNYV